MVVVDVAEHDQVEWPPLPTIGSSAGPRSAHNFRRAAVDQDMARLGSVPNDRERVTVLCLNDVEFEHASSIAGN